MSRVIDIGDDFNMSVLYEKSNEQLIVIDFYTDWCGPCKRIGPIYSHFSEYPNFSNVGFYKCNGEGTIANTEFSQDVDRYPTFLFLRDMRVIDKFIGTNADGLKEMIEKYQ
jgi:thioredoxin 1